MRRLKQLQGWARTWPWSWGLTDDDALEYIDKFIMPRVRRARDAGIPQKEIDALVKMAFRISRPPFSCPGKILDNSLDKLIDEEG